MLWHKAQGAGGVFGGDLTYDVLAGSPTEAQTSSLSVGYPSDIQAGDLLVAIGTCLNNSFAPSISGWDNSKAAGYVIFSQKIALGTETGSVSVSTPFADSSAVMIRIRNSRNLPFSADKSSQSSGYGNNSTVTLAPSSGVSYTYFANIIGFAQPGFSSVSSYPSYATPVATSASAGVFFAFVDTQFLEKEGDGAYVSASNSVSWRSFYVYN